MAAERMTRDKFLRMQIPERIDWLLEEFGDPTVEKVEPTAWHGLAFTRECPDCKREWEDSEFLEEGMFSACPRCPLCCAARECCNLRLVAKHVM